MENGLLPLMTVSNDGKAPGWSYAHSLAAVQLTSRKHVSVLYPCFTCIDTNQCEYLYYKVTMVVAHLGSVDLDLECSTMLLGSR